MSFVLYLLAGIAILAFVWVKKRNNYWSDRGFVTSKLTFPFGGIKGVGTEFTQAEGNDKLYKSFKGKTPALGTLFLFSPTILPIDPELIKNIFVRDFASFQGRGFYTNKADEPLWVNLLSLEGQEWRDRRVKMTPAFTSGKMKMMFEIVDSLGDKLIKILDKERKINNDLQMRSWAARYTTDVIGNVAFGFDCNCMEDEKSEFFKYGRVIFDLTPWEIIKFLIANSFPNLMRKLHYTISPKESLNFFMNTFSQTLKDREKNNIQRNDFVTSIMNLKGMLTPTEMAAESFLIHIGGFETSSTLLTFTMYELAINPDIQQRLRVEIQEGLEQNDGKITYDMLFGFKYLDMVMNESLRKYPPIPNQTRKCTKEYKIDGTDLVIPVGTHIEIPTFSLHRDPEYFPDPETFDPERFTPENSKARHPIAFSPFGDGPRNCIGMRFGIMQTKLAIAKLVSNYKLSPTERTPIPMKFVPSAPFLAPVGDMWLNLQRFD